MLPSSHASSSVSLPLPHPFGVGWNVGAPPEEPKGVSVPSLPPDDCAPTPDAEPVPVPVAASPWLFLPPPPPALQEEKSSGTRTNTADARIPKESSKRRS